MPEEKRYSFKKIATIIVWTLFGAGIAVLLGAAVYKKNNNRCRDVVINIKGVKNIFFIDKKDVNVMMEKLNFGTLTNKPLHTFDLAEMELQLEKNEWIRSAELYFDNNDILRINIYEREPVVRIFSTSGSSFYIDSSLKKLPLSDKLSARLPVFTGFPGNGSITKADSILLKDIRNIGTYILQNPFWMAQIDQVDITPQRTFEMIPKMGNQVIIFGTAENYEQKFNDLLLFYKNVESKVGWNKYSSLNVSYQNQIVAVKRGAEDIKADSLKTIELIKQLVANAQKEANDTLNSIQLVQPKEDNIIPFSQAHDEAPAEEQGIFNDTFSMNKLPAIPLKPLPVNSSRAMPTVNTSPSTKSKQSINSIITSKSNEKPDANLSKKQTSKPILKTTQKPKPATEPKNDY